MFGRMGPLCRAIVTKSGTRSRLILQSYDDHPFLKIVGGTTHQWESLTSPGSNSGKLRTIGIPATHRYTRLL